MAWLLSRVHISMSIIRFVGLDLRFFCQLQSDQSRLKSVNWTTKMDNAHAKCVTLLETRRRVNWNVERVSVMC